MAHVYKPTYTKPIPKDAKIIERKGQRLARFKKAGKTVDAPLTEDGSKVILESPIYHVRYKATDGTWKREKGYTDKDATQALGVRLERNAARGKEGLDDPFAEHNRRPLAEHLADFEAHLDAGNVTPGHAYNVVSRCRLIFERCGFQKIPDISGDRVEAFLSSARRERIDGVFQGRRRDKPGRSDWNVSGIVRGYKVIGKAFGVAVETVQGWRQRGAPVSAKEDTDLAAVAAWLNSRYLNKGGWSAQTSNHYLVAIKQFCKWLTECDPPRAEKNSLARLQPVNVDVDRRHDRRALVAADFSRLLDAAARGPVVEGIAGPDLRDALFAGRLDRVPPQRTGITHPPLFRPRQPHPKCQSSGVLL